MIGSRPPRGPVPGPPCPDAVEVRLAGPADLRLLESVAPDVFDRPVDPGLCARFLADDRHHLAIAVTGGVVVGMGSAVDYVHPDKPAALWINELGVSPEHRRAGIGRRLLECLLARGRSIGCTSAWVLASPENAAARALYLASGGKEAKPPPVMFELDLTTGTDPA